MCCVDGPRTRLFHGEITLELADSPFLVTDVQGGGCFPMLCVFLLICFISKFISYNTVQHCNSEERMESVLRPRMHCL